ncbi:putative enzyme related to lactoylglutathione lyase [Chitinophaga dinghuensis]|uniref:Putative enzyme related to lactoylglutathione lyase n=1 Tax=Chitinophaga dinghuensis TaxID=1539050 RepID=A0A327VQH6_9BACT|nr:VOC family protein [Chitinophaga dinghuensis]RAJ76617.1 putative enzyme related to lactoylglutathione lyase [Chitinophaga dinghuensis]
MAQSSVLRGIATLTFYAADHAAAKKWYTEFFGEAPYFDMPGYFEFRLGDYQHELGVIDSKYAPPARSIETGGAITYWHVDDIKVTFDQLIALGAKEFEPITERGQEGSGFATAALSDPFGNIIGIMTNPHYLKILQQKANQ